MASLPEHLPSQEEGIVAISLSMDSPHERAYGTFEVSVIEVDSDSEQQPLKSQTSESDACDDCCTGSEDCCVLVQFLWTPFRKQTYKVMLYHVVNFVFGVTAMVWTVWFNVLKTVLAKTGLCSTQLHRIEAASLRSLLEWESTIYNFVSPPSERVIVFSSSTSFSDENGMYGFYAQLYFGVAKLVVSAIPGAIAALSFAWSLQHLVSIIVADPDAAPLTSSAPLELPQERDLLLLLAVLAVYASALLAKLSALISRQVTMFFCADYLLYSTSA